MPSLNLVLFEEPEVFLHPPQQEILARNLMAFASAGHWQVVCATHSVHFVSKNAADIPAVVRLRPAAGAIETYQIDELRGVRSWMPIRSSMPSHRSILIWRRGFIKTTPNQKWRQ